MPAQPGLNDGHFVERVRQLTFRISVAPSRRSLTPLSALQTFIKESLFDHAFLMLKQYLKCLEGLQKAGRSFPAVS